MLGGTHGASNMRGVRLNVINSSYHKFRGSTSHACHVAYSTHTHLHMNISIRKKYMCICIYINKDGSKI